MLLSLPFLLFCSKKDEVVATFGQEKITLSEFKFAYLDIIKNPSIFDSKERREAFLDELINRRILANEAIRLGLDDDKKIQIRITAYRNKKLREIHYQKLIKPKIKIDEKNIQEAYLFSQEKRKIRHLFTQSKREADSLYSLLEQNVPFEQLAKTLFTYDSSLSRSGGNLGWVEWDQLEYDLAQTAFRQQLNEFSKPVKSQFGYHIIQVLDYQKKPIITQQEFETHRKKTKNLLEYKIGDNIANDYINTIMSDIRVQIVPNVLEFVGEKLSKNLQRKPTQYDKLFEKQLSETELRQIETSLWDMREEILATINGEAFTMYDFISFLIYIPYDVLFTGYKKTLDFAIRDFMLTRDAEDHRFDQLPELKQKTDLYEDYLLQLKLRRTLVREVKVEEDEIKNEFEQTKHDTYHNVDYQLAKEIIKKQLERDRKSQIVSLTLSSLKKKIAIKKRLDIIHEYYDSILAKNYDIP